MNDLRDRTVRHFFLVVLDEERTLKNRDIELELLVGRRLH